MISLFRKLDASRNNIISPRLPFRLEDSQETSKSLLSSYENNPKILPKQLMVDNITTERVQCIRKQVKPSLH